MNKVEVEVTKVIREKSLYHIAPCQAYLGIVTGLIRVEGIKTRSEFDYNKEVALGIDTFLEVDYSPEDYMGDDYTWVAYKYIHMDGDSTFVLPLELFASHTIKY